jgi:hypothetical protein
MLGILRMFGVCASLALFFYILFLINSEGGVWRFSSFSMEFCCLTA